MNGLHEEWRTYEKTTIMKLTMVSTIVGYAQKDHFTQLLFPRYKDLGSRVLY